MTLSSLWINQPSLIDVILNLIVNVYNEIENPATQSTVEYFWCLMYRYVELDFGISQVETELLFILLCLVRTKTDTEEIY